jgi:hypothetical protein
MITIITRIIINNNHHRNNHIIQIKQREDMGKKKEAETDIIVS